MNAPGVRVWSATPGLLSEGPRWHEERQELLWVDILGRQLHRGTLSADGALERVETISVDRHVGAVAPADGGGYVLAAGPGFLFVDDAGAVYELAQPEAGRTDVRMNDGACDPQGRFWAGTMAYDESPGAGALYRLELDGSCTTVLTGLTISNGIGWSPDASTMYLSDSGTGCVDAFRFRRLQRRHQRPPYPRAYRPAGRGAGRAHSRPRRAESGSLCGTAGRSAGTRRTGRSWPPCGCPSSGRPHAPSAGLAWTRCSSPARERTWTTMRWPASRTPAGCSPLTDLVSAASLACHTAAGRASNSEHARLAPSPSCPGQRLVTLVWAMRPGPARSEDRSLGPRCAVRHAGQDQPE